MGPRLYSITVDIFKWNHGNVHIFLMIFYLFQRSADGAYLATGFGMVSVAVVLSYCCGSDLTQNHASRRSTFAPLCPMSPVGFQDIHKADETCNSLKGML